MSTDRRAEWRSWYFYDWANSAYVTTVGTVLFAPYLISVAERSACGRVGTDDQPCTADLAVLGLMQQVTGSYRPAIVALVAFFGLGIALLSRVDARRGIAEAASTEPAGGHVRRSFGAE